jgi:hypothetical protein
MSWPADPNGSLVPILERSLAMARHPSGGGPVPGTILTAADICDRCGARAGYQVGKSSLSYGASQFYASPDALSLLFCVHHFRKHFPAMAENGWTVIGTNPEAVTA